MESMRFHHVGVIVRDLDAAARFFDALGFVCEERAEVSGAWADRVIGLSGMHVEMMFVHAPDGSGNLELSRFIEPVNSDEPVALPSNALGLRHVAYEVPDIDATVARAHAAGYELVGEVVQYEDVYRLAYIRGPEGLIVEVAEPLG